MVREIQQLVIEEPSSWLETVSRWKNLHDDEKKKENLVPQKRRSEEEINITAKKQKKEKLIEADSEEHQMEEQKKCVVPEGNNDEDFLTGRKIFLEDAPETSKDKSVESSNHSFTFRVSCRCSGAVSKVFTSQIFVHLNDEYSVVGIPVFRLPLSNREYIKTAGLRSTIAWAMASLAEISAGAFVLDPMCGLGTILLEAAKEWPNVHYLGTDISDSQLQGACENVKAADLMDKIELLKASVIALPLPSESIDVVISDVPFGKKFTITKDIKLVPDILREMERVLHVGGTVVLLLSQDPHKYVDGPIANYVENNASVNITTDDTNKTVMATDSNPREENGSPQSISSSNKNMEREPHNDKMKCFGSLVLVDSHGVSLGKTNAFICKYKKMPTSGVNSILK
ncbi:THUMP domain-containing protein 2 isoform X3 [Alligator sinensis]|uniref:U6 snRNA (guanine-N(2))-methyltransferase THUMPD2 n=1 Tax=Alligator sinensis TaxID=38654 RepID=A0A3Q0GNX3_ALLSI|nr:THUMP domain-containing protein 2 isoform X3 [Alligator sinensis]